MNDLWVLDLGAKGLKTMLLVGGPILLVALVVGLAVSIFQALTQINEATLSFIPKILAVAGTLLLMGPWILRVLASFTIETYSNIDLYLR